MEKSCTQVKLLKTKLRRPCAVISEQIMQRTPEWCKHEFVPPVCRHDGAREDRPDAKISYDNQNEANVTEIPMPLNNQEELPRKIPAAK